LVKVVNSKERKNKKVEVELEPGQYQWACGVQPIGVEIATGTNHDSSGKSCHGRQQGVYSKMIVQEI
jgi:hypothetical protein